MGGIRIKVLSLRVTVVCPNCQREGMLTINPEQTLRTPIVECIPCGATTDLRDMLYAVEGLEEAMWSTERRTKIS